MIRKLLKRLTHPFLKYASQKYFSKPRPYRYKGIEVLVIPEVFPPHFTISTKILLDYINQTDIKNKTVLELGCGSGIISLFAVSKEAIVTASDINTTALKTLEKATLKHGLELKIVNSDLFDDIKNQSFDFVIINPPYYPKTPRNIKEQAWFCGENFEYFQKLFLQLSNRKDKTVLMILSQDCNIDQIKILATQQHLKLSIEQEKTSLAEKNFIFKISNYV